MVIDDEKLRQYADFFSDRVIMANRFLQEKFPEQNVYDFQSGINFHDGFIWMEEGYKKAAKQKSQQYLHPSSWDDRAIQDGTVAKEVLALIYDKELANLIDWRDKANNIKPLMEEEKKRIPLGNCLRDIFLGSNDQESFQHAQKCIGYKFPVLSYLFFIKDPSSYLPVRPNIFAARFPLIGISGWKSGCSWDNYQDFLSAVLDVQNFLQDHYQDASISFIDAHSFIWMAWMLQDSEDAFLATVEKHCKEALQEIAKKSSKSIDAKEEAERIESEMPALEGKDKEAVVKARYFSKTDQIFMNVRPDMSIGLTEGNKYYLRHHRQKHGFD